MNEVRFCRRCLYGTDHPLGLTLDKTGLCSGCAVHEEKDNIDWGDRKELLLDLLCDYRLRRRSESYDCIVPVTGAGDSYFTLHLVKHILGLRPLAVTYNSQFNSIVGIQNLANLRETFNVDMLQMNVNPESLKRVTRATLTGFGSAYWHVLSGQSVYPVQTAVRLGIPLIVWGAHQGVEQVGMGSHFDEIEMTRRYRKEHDLMGQEAEDLMSPFYALTERDVHQFIYPDDQLLLRRGVRGIYLSNYFRWDPYSQHLQMVRDFGFQGVRNSRSFDRFDHADSNLYMGVHDWLKLAKCGYSKVTDQASREIRHGRMTRELAHLKVRHYELNPPRGLETFSHWLGASVRGVELAVIRHRSHRYWGKEYAMMGAFAGWSKLRDPEELPPIVRQSLGAPVSERFAVVGRGHPHLDTEGLM